MLTPKVCAHTIFASVPPLPLAPTMLFQPCTTSLEEEESIPCKWTDSSFFYYPRRGEYTHPWCQGGSAFCSSSKAKTSYGIEIYFINNSKEFIFFITLNNIENKLSQLDDYNF
jgi:hypothetical protein